MTLEEFFSRHPKAALGFSGGVDSAYLLYTAVQCGAQIQPYFIKTSFQPEFELEDARRLTEELNMKLIVTEYDILSHPQVAANSKERCYHCKTAIFTHLKDQALADGYTLLLDGTNASDDWEDRPGMRALKELKIRSPLRECGLTKSEIRRLSKEEGLFTHDKPSYACLATRFPFEAPLTEKSLKHVEQAESELREMGFSDFRVRVDQGAARLEFSEGQWLMAARLRQGICSVLKPYFQKILLDMEVR